MCTALAQMLHMHLHVVTWATALEVGHSKASVKQIIKLNKRHSTELWKESKYFSCWSDQNPKITRALENIWLKKAGKQLFSTDCNAKAVFSFWFNVQMSTDQYKTYW